MRSSKGHCRAIRRYFIIFTVIALLPLSIVYYLVTNDHIYKIKGYYEGDSKKSLAERTFRYPLIIIGELAKKASGNRRAAKKLARLKYYINDTNLQTLPQQAIQTLSENDRNMVEMRMIKRKEHLEQKCSEYGLDVSGNDGYHKANPWEYLINIKRHLIWCNVFKAASSSWMYNFNILAGYTPEFLRKTSEVPLVLARRRYPRVSIDELREAQNDSITFMIARHPFERLLSAYRDKFVFSVPHSFHDRLGRKIIRNYRKKSEKNSPKYPTFSEFINWLLDEIRRNNYIDMHLVPYTKFCTPCLIKMDAIIKFESLQDDQIYLIEKAALTNIILPQWKNSGKGKNTLELLQQYYSQLTRKQLDGLYEFYKYDFELFDYNPSPYFSIVSYPEENEPKR